ncbi:MAG: transketolase [Nitriliruptoraceae bacterium]
MSEQLDQQAITTIRTLAIDAVQQANSGHPGMPMGCAPIAHLLFNETMRHDPNDPSWCARDRFVLSAGHGSMLIYAALHLAGYARPTLEDLKAFRQSGSVTAGHPENFLLDGVETTTGPLGQGFANGVGMAIAAERLAAEFNRDGFDVVPQRIFGIVSDGDLMEGVASEAASLAGHLQLGRIVYLYDDNKITIDGGTDKAFSEDVAARFAAYGWHTDEVSDGNDLDALRNAITQAINDPRPSLIKVRTVIGFGSPNKQGTSGSHGAPLGPDEVALTKAQYGWDHPPFTVPADVKAFTDQGSDGATHHQNFNDLFAAYKATHPELAQEFERRVITRELPENWRDALPVLDTPAATRVHSGAVINALAPVIPELFGGSADLAASNNTDIQGGGDFQTPGVGDGRHGRNVRFGVREHAMAAIANGMTLHGGVIPYVASFLVFSDYLRPSLRLAALMNLNVIYVMTHDSIGLGEDGPTHQPVEHVASLRAMPNVTVIRPADGVETVAAWEHALTSEGPTVLALSRQTLPPLARPGDADVSRGGYVLHETHGRTADICLIGTGSETHLCVAAATSLEAAGHAVRVVSLPSAEVFSAQPADYQIAVLPDTLTRRVVVEAGVSFGWEKIAGANGTIIALNRYGASAPAEELFSRFGFTAEAIVNAATALLER